MNYLGDQMRPSTFNPTPFIDNNTGQSVGFVNLPIDQTTVVHRGVIPGATIPTAPPDGTNTPQTALIGATYSGTQTFPVSPDTPHKAVPDDASYDAPSGGVLATLILQVVGNESGQPSLFMNLDDNSPNPPGSAVVIFNGTGTTTLISPRTSSATATTARAPPACRWTASTQSARAPARPRRRRCHANRRWRPPTTRPCAVSPVCRTEYGWHRVRSSRTRL